MIFQNIKKTKNYQQINCALVIDYLIYFTVNHTNEKEIQLHIQYAISYYINHKCKVNMDAHLFLPHSQKYKGILYTQLTHFTFTCT